MKSSPKKLNLGCGARFVEQWTNVDYSIGARLVRIPLLGRLVRKSKIFGIDWNPQIVIHDLTTPFPWADGSVDEVYSSHTLEHMTLEQGKQFLKESFRVLKSGGVLRIVVPDLAPIVQRYLNHKLTAEKFLDDLYVLYSTYPSKMKTKLAPLMQFPHKCMYDAEALLRICSDLGISAELSRPFVSKIESIHDIELPDRVVDALIVEAIKP